MTFQESLEMRTIFRYPKPFQKEFQNLQGSLRKIQNKPKQVHNGKGVPSNVTGQNGDLYIDKSGTGENKDIYLKDNGQWV